jgi:hypothetical protein
MSRRPDSIAKELPLTARQRVRLPDALAPSGIFHGWGPGLER